MNNSALWRAKIVESRVPVGLKPGKNRDEKFFAICSV